MYGPEITRTTFSGMPAKDKLNILFDFAVKSHECVCKTDENVALLKKETEEKLTSLEKKVDRRWKWNASIAAVSGFIGGIVAHIGQGVLTGREKPPAGA